MGIGAGLVVAAVLVDVFLQNAQALVELVVQLLEALALRGAGGGGPAPLGEAGGKFGRQGGKFGLGFLAQHKPLFQAPRIGHEPAYFGQRTVFLEIRSLGFTAALALVVGVRAPVGAGAVVWSAM